MTVHQVKGGMQSRRVNIVLIGAGGNGSQMLTGLALLDRALRATGHRHGLHVVTCDNDLVSEANVGRQLFYPPDIGQHKSIILTHRINCAFGLDWQAVPHRFSMERTARNRGTLDIVISCVDSVTARREIYQEMRDNWLCVPNYWLDLGNDKSIGQVILGEPASLIMPDAAAEAWDAGNGESIMRGVSRQTRARLPTYFDEFPEMLTGEIEESDTPSCSLAEALAKQDLFINRAVTTFALELLSKLLRQGQIAHRGYYINLESGRVNPIPIDGEKERIECHAS